MLPALTLLLVCQLLGEIVIRALGLPVPGPVLGMFFLFLFLLLRDGPSTELRTTAQALLQHLSLLFVPAGTGVVLYLRLIQEVTQNFALAWEGSYQYMDLQPEGYNDRHAVNGSFYKLTFAPTFKVGSIGDFFSRPEIRFYTSWMDWSKKLDNYANDDALGSNGFKSGGEWSFGMQMETWF
jgi:putative effector of murein hydrolase LrgA (UPF0299 family)